jgi:hypothetical protein
VRKIANPAQEERRAKLGGPPIAADAGG